MAVQYAANGDSLRPEKPRAWGEGRFTRRGGVNRFFNLHPDGERVALALAPEALESRQDKLVFISNILDELRRNAP